MTVTSTERPAVQPAKKWREMNVIEKTVFVPNSLLRSPFMSRCLPAMVLFLLVCSAFAQEEGAANVPPSETVGLIWVAIFGVIFVGMIVGFFGYLWWRERNQKPEVKGRKTLS
jgi:hypothetical protein